MNPLTLFDKGLAILDKSLDLRAQNQRVIAANVANSETPGYAPAQFEFENELKNAINQSGTNLATTHEKHIPIGGSTINQVTGTLTRTPDNTGIGDENGVSVDQEMIKMSENQLMYEASAQLLKKKLSQIRFVVSDGQ